MSAPGQKRRDPIGWLVRVAWGRRLETGLTFATVVARVGLASTFGTTVATIVLGGCGLALIANRPTRGWMVGLYGRERLERHYARVFAAVGIDHGATPAVLDQQLTTSGVVLDLALSPGCTASDLAKRTESLAVALSAARTFAPGPPWVTACPLGVTPRTAKA